MIYFIVIDKEKHQYLFIPLRTVYLRASCVTKLMELEVKNEYIAFPISAKYLWKNNRDFKIQRRGRQREGKKNNRFNKQNNYFARASHFFCTFLSRFYTTTTWKRLISRFKEDVNKQRRNFKSLSELGYGHLKFSFRRVRPHLTK